MTRNIVVTGATRGCGRALVEQLVRAGHRVNGCGRTQEAIDELRRAHGAPHLFEVVDVRDDEGVRGFAARVLAAPGAPGAPDLVINNAGLINASAPLWAVPAEEFSRVVDVNLKGTAGVMRAFLPAMIARGRGVIVNMSSGWGRSTSPEVAPYCATKWAVEGLSRAVAQEVPSGLAVLAVNPGVIHTEMLESCYGERALHYESPARWARRAVPFLLGLGPGDNGTSVSVPPP